MEKSGSECGAEEAVAEPRERGEGIAGSQSLTIFQTATETEQFLHPDRLLPPLCGVWVDCWSLTNETARDDVALIFRNQQPTSRADRDSRLGHGEGQLLTDIFFAIYFEL